MRLLSAIPVVALALAPVLGAADGQPGMQSTIFKVLLSPTKEAPPITDAQDMGDAWVEFNVHRAEDGMVDMVIVDFRVNYALGSPQTLRAMHIHQGMAGMNGPIVVGSDFGPPIDLPAGNGSFFRTAVLNDPMSIEAAMAILDDPAGYYLNVHSSAHPPGHFRGQLMPVDTLAGSIGEVSAKVDANAQAIQSVLEKTEQLDQLIRIFANSMGVTIPGL